MLANPNDYFIGQALIDFGEYSELELCLLLQLAKSANSTVVEVGSNIGTHTIPLAKALESKDIELIAFEPQQFIFQNLCANLALNNISNVRTFPFACGDKSETVWFKKVNYQKFGNFGGVKMHEDEARPKSSAYPTQVVRCVKLDDVLDTVKISILKIDVEGFEQKVLVGAKNLISINRPVIYVENHDSLESSTSLIEYLWQLGYTLYWHLPKLINPDNFFGNKANPYPTIVSVNMLCVPKEHNSKIKNLTEIVDSKFHPILTRRQECE